MSWYLHKLLSRGEQIRENVISGYLDLTDTTRNFNDLPVLCDFDTDLYSDLLTVESKINQLKEKNLLTKNDLTAIECIKSGKSYLQLELELGNKRENLLLWVKDFLEKLSYHLGGYFTDAGYLEMLKNKYNLSDEDVLAAKLYIDGNFKLKRGNNNNAKK